MVVSSSLAFWLMPCGQKRRECLTRQGGDLLANDAIKRHGLLGLDSGLHFFTRTGIDLWDGCDELFAVFRARNVVRNRRLEHGGDVLRSIGQGGVGAGGDALHALGAVLRDVEGGLATRHVLRLGGTGACGHDADCGEGPCGLVIAESIAVFAVELVEREDGGFGLLFSARGKCGDRIGKDACCW